MSSDTNISGYAPNRGAFDAALVRQFAARQNVGAIATFVVTYAIIFVIWSHVPRAILIPWAALQTVIAILSIVRWNPVRHLDETSVNAHALIREAVAWKAVAGAMWGVLAIFSSFYLPQSLEFFTAIAVAAVAIGGISTMAAIPAAMYAFIILSVTPFIVVWLTGGDLANVTLGLLSILLLAVIINSARIAHAQILSLLQSELELRELTEEFEAARGEWLELADTTESYVVFDPQDRLVAWNKQYAELLRVPPDLLRRGTPRADIIKRARQAVSVKSGNVSIDQWARQRIDPKNNAGDDSIVTEFEDGLWIQRRNRHSKNGNLVISHVDLTDLVKLEMAQRESEERYRLIAENSPDALFVRLEDEIVYVNPAAVKLLGADSEADLLGMSLLSFYHPADLSIIRANKDKIAQNPGEPLPPTRARMRRFDGSDVMTAGAAANHIWKGQAAVLITRRDITAQMEAEERLRESESRYRRIADLSPVAILVRVDDLIVYANPAAIKMFGAECEADLLYESMMSFVHPDDKHLVLNNRVIMKKDIESAAPAIKVRRRRFDGNYFYSEGSGAPFVWQGQPAVMVMLRDVSREDEVDRRIQESEEQLRAIVENMPGSIVLKDTNLRIRLASGRNYGHWAGISAADAIGKTAADMVPADLAAELERRDREVLKSGNVIDVEVNTNTADGQSRTFLSTRFPVKDESGTIIGIGIINHDVTDQRKTEAHLQRTLETVGDGPGHRRDR